MLPLIVVVAVSAVLRSAGALGPRALKDWRVCLRFALAVMFLITSTAHWGAKRADLIAMVPPFFPRPELLVTLTGICEIAGAIGLMIPRLARLAAALLALMLVAMFPANYYAAEQGLQIGGKPVTELPQRTAVQVVLVAACVAIAVKPGTRTETSTITA